VISQDGFPYARARDPRYEDLNREELLRLLEARDRRDATKFGLVWEADEIERDKVLNSDFVADLAPRGCFGGRARRIFSQDVSQSRHAPGQIGEHEARDQTRHG
jgi:hypothetical protein